MIEFSTSDGQPVAVNPAAIWHVRPANGEQCALYNLSGGALFVVESYDEVVARLREADAPARGAS